MTGGPISDRRLISHEDGKVQFWARVGDQTGGGDGRSAPYTLTQIFYFLGRKDGFHYFEIPNEGFYRVANGTAATDMPLDLPGKNPFGSVGLFVVFRDDKLSTPTSDELADAGIDTTPTGGE
ncbi:hypothetical protein Pla100_63400 [Neorhodopirellula pilleata]|uniref:Uncharacterized protein n=1 Tax=Neorhodopirellula pilleata TaxID=2714738 RepID=A0A5C5YQZ7_9BACT|nr:hypothetical protein Pla100_63400 [Neorhodopirellula pilleata]